LACAATIVGLSIAGLVYSSTIITKYNKAKCAIYLIINEALYGASDDFSKGYTWIGSSGVKELGDEALISLHDNESTLIKIGDIDVDEDDENNFPLTDQFLDELNLESGTGNVRNPETGTPGMKIQILEKTDGEYPFVKILKEEVEEFKDNIVPSLAGLTRGAADASEDGKLDDVRSSLKTIEDFNEEVKGIRGTVYDFLDIIEIGFVLARVVMVIYYALIMIFIGIILLGSIFVTMCSSKWCRCVNNLGCILLMIFIIIGFLLTSLLFPISVVLMEGCDMLNPDKLEKNGLVDTLEELEVCLVGSGDLYTEKGLGSDLEFADQVAGGLDSVALIYDGTNMKYPAAKALIEDYKTIANEEPYRASTDIFPTSDLRLGSIPNGDRIVWSGCNGPDQTIADSCINGNNPICISITKCTVDSGGDEAAIRARYQNNLGFADRLVNHIKFANDVKEEIGKVLNYIERDETATATTTTTATGTTVTATANTYYNKMDADTKNNRVKDVVTAVNEIEELDDLTEATKMLGVKLKDGLNCKFMKESLRRVHGSFCGNLIQLIAFAALFMGLISSISLLLVITMVCINRYFYIPQREGKKHTASD